MNPYLEIMRPKQWIKNLLIFIPLILFMKFDYLPMCIMGFIGLSLASSAGYINNDIINRDEDRKNGKDRPLASGRIKTTRWVVLQYGILLGLSMVIFPPVYILIIIDLFYNLLGRNEKYIDVVTISLKYPIRLWLGFVILSVAPTKELLIAIFGFALCLAAMKRKGELASTMKKGALYSVHAIDILFAIGITTFILSFSLFSELLLPLVLINMIAIERYYVNIKDYSKAKSLAIIHDRWFILTGIILCAGVLALWLA